MSKLWKKNISMVLLYLRGGGTAGWLGGWAAWRCCCKPECEWPGIGGGLGGAWEKKIKCKIKEQLKLWLQFLQFKARLVEAEFKANNNKAYIVRLLQVIRNRHVCLKIKNKNIKINQSKYNEQNRKGWTVCLRRSVKWQNSGGYEFNSNLSSNRGEKGKELRK